MIQKSDGAERRLLITGPFDYPKTNAASHLILDIAAALKEKGWSTTVIGRSTSARAQSSEQVLKGGVRLLTPIPSTRPTDLRLAHRLSNVILSQLPSSVCVIMYNTPSPVLLRTLLASRKYDIPVLGYATEWYGRASARVGVKEIFRLLDTECRMRLIHPRTDGLLVSSTLLARYYEPKPVHVIPGLITPSKDARKEHAKHPRGVNLVYAGVPFQLNKGPIPEEFMKDRLDLVLEWCSLALSQRLDFHLDVYGLTREQYLRAVPHHHKLVRALAGNVTFHGHVSQEVVKAATMDASYTVLVRNRSRVTEAGFPTKVLESLSMGTPVIASDVGDVGSYLCDRASGVLLPQDEELASQTFLSVLAEPLNLRNDTRGSWLESIEQRWNSEAASLSDFLEDMIRTRHG